MKKKIIYHILPVLLLLNVIHFNGKAQNNTMFWMKNLPQSTYFNPAKQPACKLFLDLPLLPNFSVNASHSGFTLNDAINPYPTVTDSFIIDLNGIENALNEKNQINSGFEISILNLGFVIRNDLYASFGINYKAEENFQYPKDLIELRRFNYREDETPISFNFKQNLNVYREIYIGLSKDFNNGLKIGGRLKLLSGYANISTNQLKIDWYTETDPDSMYDWTFVSDFDIKISEPVNYTIQYDSAGIIESVEFEKYIIKDHISEIIFPGNPGFAIDFGVEYNLYDRLIFSASVIDFGFIKWNSNPSILTQKTTFKFSGLDFANYVGSLEEAQTEQSTIFSDIAFAMLDTLKTVFNPQIESVSYRTNLNTKIFLGTNFIITDYLDLGFLYRAFITNKSLNSGYSFSANTNFLKAWSYSLSYSIMNGKANNIGMGLAYKTGPWQMYLVSDNLSVPFWLVNESDFSDNWLKNTKAFNFAFGLNYLICNKNVDIGLLE